MPTYQHSLSEVINALNSKIAALQVAKDAVEQRIKGGQAVAQNTAVLQKINQSLDAAGNAKTLMNDSCCTSQNCDFVYYD